MFLFSPDTPAAKPDINQMSDEDIDNLGMNAMKSLDINSSLPVGQENIPPQDADPLPPQQPDPEETPSPQEGKEQQPPAAPEQPAKKSVIEQIAEIESIPKDQRSEVQTVELRRLHGEKKIAELMSDRDKARNELEELRKKALKEEEPEPDFEVLSESEQDALMREDPDEYKKYKAEEKQFEDQQVAKAQQANLTTWNNITDFYKEKTGQNGNFDPATDANFQKWLNSDEFMKIDNFVSQNFNKVKGAHTIDQLRAADRSVNHESYIANAKLAGRNEALKDTDPRNFSDSSAFDTVPKTDGSKGAKKVSELQDNEIENMGQSALKAWQKQMAIDAGEGS